MSHRFSPEALQDAPVDKIGRRSGISFRASGVLLAISDNGRPLRELAPVLLTEDASRLRRDFPGPKGALVPARGPRLRPNSGLQYCRRGHALQECPACLAGGRSLAPERIRERS